MRKAAEGDSPTAVGRTLSRPLQTLRSVVEGGAHLLRTMTVLVFDQSIVKGRHVEQLRKIGRRHRRKLAKQRHIDELVAGQEGAKEASSSGTDSKAASSESHSDEDYTSARLMDVWEVSGSLASDPSGHDVTSASRSRTSQSLRASLKADPRLAYPKLSRKQARRKLREMSDAFVSID